MYQDFDIDESDLEQNTKIREEFGVKGGGFKTGHAEALDQGINMYGLVQHTFNIYDGLAAQERRRPVGDISIYDDEERTSDFVELAEVLDIPNGAPPNEGLANCDQHLFGAKEDLTDDDLLAMEQSPPTRHQLLEDNA